MAVDIRRHDLSQGETEIPAIKYRLSALEVDGKRYPHLETTDFPISDPWSQKMMSTIHDLRGDGFFTDLPVLELGVGDGRETIQAAQDTTDITVVDLEGWRLNLALKNFKQHEKIMAQPITAFEGDAVALLQEWDTVNPGKRIGTVIACLPQSLEGENAADTIKDNPRLDPYRDQWDEHGLTLNAAALDALQQHSEGASRVLLMLNHRIQSKYRLAMIQETGWEVVDRYKTEFPIQQDPDTGVERTIKNDDGRRFYERQNSGLYVPISAAEAEARRKNSIADGKGREELNVLHHLSVYDLKIKENFSIQVPELPDNSV
jgi:hypothetical protein